MSSKLKDVDPHLVGRIIVDTFFIVTHSSPSTPSILTQITHILSSDLPSTSKVSLINQHINAIKHSHPALWLNNPTDAFAGVPISLSSNTDNQNALQKLVKVCGTRLSLKRFALSGVPEKIARNTIKDTSNISASSSHTAVQKRQSPTHHNTSIAPPAKRRCPAPKGALNVLAPEHIDTSISHEPLKQKQARPQKRGPESLPTYSYEENSVTPSPHKTYKETPHTKFSASSNPKSSDIDSPCSDCSEEDDRDFPLSLIHI